MARSHARAYTHTPCGDWRARAGGAVEWLGSSTHALFTHTHTRSLTALLSHTHTLAHIHARELGVPAGVSAPWHHNLTFHSLTARAHTHTHARTHRGLVLGVVVPAAVLLRFPALIPVALRGALAVGQLVFVALARSGQLGLAADMLWKRVVALAKEQQARAVRKKR